MKTTDYTEPSHDDILGKRLSALPRCEMPEDLGNAIMEEAREKAARSLRRKASGRYTALAAGVVAGIGAMTFAVAFTGIDMHSILRPTLSLLKDTVFRIDEMGPTFIPLFTAAALPFTLYMLLDAVMRRRNGRGASR